MVGCETIGAIWGEGGATWSYEALGTYGVGEGVGLWDLSACLLLLGEVLWVWLGFIYQVRVWDKYRERGKEICTP